MASPEAGAIYSEDDMCEAIQSAYAEGWNGCLLKLREHVGDAPQYVVKRSLRAKGETA